MKRMVRANSKFSTNFSLASRMETATDPLTYRVAPDNDKSEESEAGAKIKSRGLTLQQIESGPGLANQVCELNLDTEISRV